MNTEVKKSPPSEDWFRKIPRRFFGFPILIYSLYAGFGFLVAGALHYTVWMHNGQMKTLFSYLQSDSSKPSPALALLLFAAVGLLATVVFVFLLRRIRRERGNLELAFWGTATSFILAWLPWLFASSVVNTVFLFLFGMVSIVGFGLRRRLSSRWTRERGARPDFWKMFVNAIKACAAVIAVLLGAIATSVLLPWRNTEVEEFELLRYAFLCAYVITGMIVFVLLPLLARSLENDPSEEVELEVPGPL